MSLSQSDGVEMIKEKICFKCHCEEGWDSFFFRKRLNNLTLVSSQAKRENVTLVSLQDAPLLSKKSGGARQSHMERMHLSI